MEEKINIAEILKDKQKGIRLYSPIFGECTYCYVREDTNDIFVKKHNGLMDYFNSEGLYFALGEVMLFPSKEMRVWDKFAWKKGDVLVSNDYGTEVIFYDWYDDTYTNFYGKHRLDSENKNNIKYNDAFLCTTARYSLEDKDAAQTYINTIEERLGGKLNLETLKIEKQQEFKDGDIITITTQIGNILTFIFRAEDVEKYYCHAFLYGKIVIANDDSFCKKDFYIARQSTEEEQKQLFDALAKEGKYWDVEKKEVVDLKPKIELKPFDKVVVRCSEADRWSIDFFSYKVHNGYICTGDAWFGYCLPYNDETAHLIGTTDEWKGGEG